MTLFAIDNFPKLFSIAGVYAGDLREVSAKNMHRWDTLEEALGQIASWGENLCAGTWANVKKKVAYKKESVVRKSCFGLAYASVLLEHVYKIPHQGMRVVAAHTINGVEGSWALGGAVDSLSTL